MATSVDTEVVEVYLDHAASTPLRPEAQAAWLDASARHHANPTGAHRAARAARRALDDARDEIAAALDRPPAEVVFTSGGSEADNLAIRGVLHAQGGIAVCSAGEHHAVLEPVEHAGGLTVELEADGTVSPDRLAAVLDAADQPVSVVSIMVINNETGVVNDIPALVEVTRRHAPGAWFHTDAVQALAWIDLAAHVEGADLISITGHKFGGPVGTGALFWRTVSIDARRGKNETRAIRSTRRAERHARRRRRGGLRGGCHRHGCRSRHRCRAPWRTARSPRGGPP